MAAVRASAVTDFPGDLTGRGGACPRKGAANFLSLRLSQTPKRPQEDNAYR